jgi:hypothetical protein
MPTQIDCDRYRDKCERIVTLLKDGIPNSVLARRGIRRGSRREKRLRETLAKILMSCCARYSGFIELPPPPPSPPGGLPTATALALGATLAHPGGAVGGGAAAGEGPLLETLWRWLQSHGSRAFLARFGIIALVLVTAYIIQRGLREQRCELILQIVFDIPGIVVCFYRCGQSIHWIEGPASQAPCPDEVYFPV